MSGLDPDVQRIIDLLPTVYREEAGWRWLTGTFRGGPLKGQVPLQLIAQGEAKKVADVLDGLADGVFW